MARYRGSVCRLCRRENVKMFLKGDRCFSDKCAFDRRGYPPGQHGQRRGRQSFRLRHPASGKAESQADVRPFRKAVPLVFQTGGQTEGNHRYESAGHARMPFGQPRLPPRIRQFQNQGRHFVKHNHFLVNGKKVNIPSYMVKIGDVVEVREKSRKIQAIEDSMDAVVRRGIPQWLELEKDTFKGNVKALPVRDDITMPIQEQLIVELYSK